MKKLSVAWLFAFAGGRVRLEGWKKEGWRRRKRRDDGGAFVAGVLLVGGSIFYLRVLAVRSVA